MIPTPPFGLDRHLLYELAHLVGIAAGLAAAVPLLRADPLRLSWRRVAAVLLAVLVAAHAGAHAWSVLSHPGRPAAAGASWVSRTLFSDLSLHGGLLGAALALLGAAAALRQSPWELGDALAPGGALGLAVFRLGCWARGCCHGRPLPEGHVLEGLSTHLIHNREVWLHPTQLYAATAAAGLAAGLVLLRRHRRFPGQVAIAFALVYAPTRFLVELVRADSPHDLPLGPLLASANQLWALGLGVAAAAVGAWRWRTASPARR